MAADAGLTEEGGGGVSVSQQQLKTRRLALKQHTRPLALTFTLPALAQELLLPPPPPSGSNATADGGDGDNSGKHQRRLHWEAQLESSLREFCEVSGHTSRGNNHSLNHSLTHSRPLTRALALTHSCSC